MARRAPSLAPYTLWVMLSLLFLITLIPLHASPIPIVSIESITQPDPQSGSGIPYQLRYDYLNKQVILIGQPASLSSDPNTLAPLHWPHDYPPPTVHLSLPPHLSSRQLLNRPHDILFATGTLQTRSLAGQLQITLNTTDITPTSPTSPLQQIRKPLQLTILLLISLLLASRLRTFSRLALAYRRLSLHQCPNCTYHLLTNTSQCPECGLPAPHSLFRPRLLPTLLGLNHNHPRYRATPPTTHLR